MLSGRFFRLNSSTLGIHSVSGQRTAIVIPEGAVIQVVSGPRVEDRMIDVTWEGRRLSVFTEDFLARGAEVPTVKEDRAALA